MMLGEMRLEGRMYGRGEPTLVGNGRDLAEQLAEAIALLPRDVFRPEARRVAPPTLDQSFPAPEHIKPNAYALVNDQIAIRDGDALHVLTGLSNQVARRIRGLIRVRDAVRRCLRSQLNGTPDEDVVAAREHLNRTYDRFVARFGPISARANTSAFRGDPDLPLLLSLEQYDEETGRATKAAIFRERTIQKQRPVPQVSTAKEALLVTLNERGCVDLDFLAGLLHRKPSEFLPDLKGTDLPQPADPPLGDRGRIPVRQCPREAGRPPRPRRWWTSSSRPNVEALRQVQPTDLSATEIDARLGSTWIPAEDIQRFAEETLGESGITVSHAPQLGLWVVRGGYERPVQRRQHHRVGHRPAQRPRTHRRRPQPARARPSMTTTRTPTATWSTARPPRPPATSRRSSKSGSSSGSGRTTSAANGWSASTTTSSTTPGCAPSTAST